MSVGHYWGGSPEVRRSACRWDGDGWVRCPTTGSYPHPLRLPVCQSGSACAGAVPRVQGGSVRSTCGTFEPRTFTGGSHTGAHPGGGTPFVFLLVSGLLFVF